MVLPSEMWRGPSASLDGNMNDIRANAMTIDIEYNAKKCYSENQLKFLHKNSKNFLKFHNQYDKQNI